MMLRADQWLFILMAMLALAAFILFWSVLGMVVLGASVAVVLLPLHHRISRRTSTLASAMLVTLFIVFLSAVAMMVTFFIFAENTAPLTTIVDTIGTWLANPASDPLEIIGRNVSPSMAQYVHSQFIYWLGVAKALFVDFNITLVNNLSRIAIDAFTFFLSFFILMLYGERLRVWGAARIPFLFITRHGKRLSSVVVDTLYVLYIAQFAIALLTFFIAIPVFYVLGFGDVLFYSFLAAFCELIPIFGSSVAFIVVGAYALALGDIQGVLILFFLGWFGVSALPEIFIRPILMGRRVHVHPVVMFTGFIGGILTMGLAGFVVGPVALVLLITGYMIYREREKGSELPMAEHRV